MHMVPHPNNMLLQPTDGRDPKRGDVVVDISVKKEIDHDAPPRKAVEQPNTTITMVNGPTDSKGKERFRITVSFREEIQKICWYGEDTPAKNIEDVIRTAFGLPHHAALLLKNTEGDVVAVSSSLPSNEIFHLQVGHTRQLPRDNGNDEYEDSGDVKHESDTHSDSSHSSPDSPATAIVAVVEDDNSPISIKSSPHMRSPPEQIVVEGEVPRYPVLIEGIPQPEYDYQRLMVSGMKRDLQPMREEKIKRKRRKAIEIERSYKCSVGSCHKVYGSENALKMHIKLKHPDFVNLVPVVMVNSHLSQDYHSHHPPSHSHVTHSPHAPPSHPPPSHSSHHHPPPPPPHHAHHTSGSNFSTYRQYPSITPAIPSQSPSTPPSQSHLIRSPGYNQSPRHSPYGSFPQSPQFSPRMSAAFGGPPGPMRSPHPDSHPPYSPHHSSHMSHSSHPPSHSPHPSHSHSPHAPHSSHPSHSSHSHSSHPPHHMDHPVVVSRSSPHPGSHMDSHPNFHSSHPDSHAMVSHHGNPPPHHGGSSPHHPSSSHHPPPSSHHGPPPSHHGPPSSHHSLPPSLHGPPPPHHGPSHHGPPSHHSSSHHLPPSSHHPSSPHHPPPSSHHPSQSPHHPSSHHSQSSPHHPPPSSHHPPASSHHPSSSSSPHHPPPSHHASSPPHHSSSSHHPPPSSSSSSHSRDLPAFTQLPPIQSIQGYTPRHSSLPSLGSGMHKEGQSSSSPPSSGPPSSSHHSSLQSPHHAPPPSSHLPSVSSIVGTGRHHDPAGAYPGSATTTTTTTTTTTITTDSGSPPPPKKENFVSPLASIAASLPPPTNSSSSNTTSLSSKPLNYQSMQNTSHFRYSPLSSSATLPFRGAERGLGMFRENEHLPDLATRPSLLHVSTRHRYLSFDNTLIAPHHIGNLFLIELCSI